MNTILFTGSAGSPSAEQGYAIGVDRVREVLADFRDGRSRAWFGAGLLTPLPPILRRQQLPPGMLVTAAQEGTSADELRLEQVLITAIGGEPVKSSLARYCSAVGDAESGDELDVTVIAERAAASRRSGSSSTERRERRPPIVGRASSRATVRTVDGAPRRVG